jgi:hypothetical protein
MWDAHSRGFIFEHVGDDCDGNDEEKHGSCDPVPQDEGDAAEEECDDAAADRVNSNECSINKLLLDVAHHKDVMPRSMMLPVIEANASKKTPKLAKIKVN